MRYKIKNSLDAILTG